MNIPRCVKDELRRANRGLSSDIPYGGSVTQQLRLHRAKQLSDNIGVCAMAADDPMLSHHRYAPISRWDAQAVAGQRCRDRRRRDQKEIIHLVLGETRLG
jgi:hypothetical protein